MPSCEWSKSKLDWFLAGQAEAVHLEMVGDAVAVEKVSAGEVGAENSGLQFLVASGTATLAGGTFLTLLLRTRL